MTISVVDWVDLYLLQWYGIPNSVIDEAELIIVSERFPDSGNDSIRLYWKVMCTIHCDLV